MRQVIEFSENVQKAAKQYVEAYLQHSATRDFHLRFMRDCDLSGFAYLQELAECIDILLFNKDMEEWVFSLELQQEPLDHEYWSAFE